MLGRFWTFHWHARDVRAAPANWLSGSELHVVRAVESASMRRCSKTGHTRRLPGRFGLVTHRRCVDALLQRRGRISPVSVSPYHSEPPSTWFSRIPIAQRSRPLSWRARAASVVRYGNSQRFVVRYMSTGERRSVGTSGDRPFDVDCAGPRGNGYFTRIVDWCLSLRFQTQL